VNQNSRMQNTARETDYLIYETTRNTQEKLSALFADRRLVALLKNSL
jgi:16S rRNA C1402 (ribose-2'-O) methylase RsmI